MASRLLLDEWDSVTVGPAPMAGRIVLSIGRVEEAITRIDLGFRPCHLPALRQLVASLEALEDEEPSYGL